MILNWQQLHDSNITISADTLNHPTPYMYDVIIYRRSPTSKRHWTAIHVNVGGEGC